MKNKLLCWILGVLGFAGMVSCEGDTIKHGAEEYGQPYVKFTLKGNVTDEESQPVKGIQIKFTTPGYMYGDSFALTDQAGDYVLIEPYLYPPKENTELTVTATDIDGEENGLFKESVKVTDFEDVTFNNPSGNWYDGDGTKTVDFVLEAAEPEAEK